MARVSLDHWIRENAAAVADDYSIPSAGRCMHTLWRYLLQRSRLRLQPMSPGSLITVSALRARSSFSYVLIRVCLKLRLMVTCLLTLGGTAINTPMLPAAASNAELPETAGDTAWILTSPAGTMRESHIPLFTRAAEDKQQKGGPE